MIHPRRLLGSALLLSAAGCLRSMASGMDTWLGNSDADLVSSWGAPTRSITLADSSRVLTWVTRGCEQSFTVSPAGKILRWSTGSACPRTFINP